MSPVRVRAVQVAGFFLGVLSLAPRLAAQQDSTPPAQAEADQRLNDLDQQVKELAKRFQQYQDSVQKAGKSKPQVTAGANGFQLKSADGNFVLKLRGYLQADGRFFANDDAKVLTNDFLLRRVRPILEGTVYKYYDFRIMYDFSSAAPSIFDAYFEARFEPEFNVRAGKFRPPLALERFGSATDLKFVERGFPTNLVPTRDIGLQLGGDLGGGVVNYALDVFDGVPDLGNGSNDIADGKDLAGRILIFPFAKQIENPPVDLAFGIAGSTGNEEGSTVTTGLASYRSASQTTVFRYLTSATTPVTGTAFADGRRTRIVPQAYLYKGPVGLLAEYAISRQEVARDTGLSRTSETLEQKAWQVQASFLLTGEKNTYRTVSPRTQFDPLAGTWGAFELVGRYGEIDFDDDAFPRYASPTASVTEARAWGVGINWYLARGLKLMLDYEHTTFVDGDPNGDRPTENFIATRVQTSF